ncbi:MAG: hypothetical protein R3C11_20140 [Planctomycetaceae bacterium]
MNDSSSINVSGHRSLAFAPIKRFSAIASVSIWTSAILMGVCHILMPLADTYYVQYEISEFQRDAYFITSIVFTFFVLFSVPVALIYSCLWFYRTFLNLRHFTSGFFVSLPLLAVVSLGVPVLNLIAGFPLFTMLFRRSSLDEDIYSGSIYKVPRFVSIRMFPLFFFGWIFLLLNLNLNKLKYTFGYEKWQWIEWIIIGCNVTVFIVSAWCLVTFMRRVTQMQEEKFSVLVVKQSQCCEKCGEVVAREYEVCPLCGSDRLTSLASNESKNAL